MFDDAVRDALYLNVGRCLTAWNLVEDEILQLTALAFFTRGGLGDTLVAPGYWAVVSFEARLKLCSAIITRALEGEHQDLLERWNTLKNSAHTKNQKRAEVAHGSVVVMRHGKEKKLQAYFFPYYHKRRSKHRSKGLAAASIPLPKAVPQLRVEDLIDRTDSFYRLRDDLQTLASDWLARDIFEANREQ